MMCVVQKPFTGAGQEMVRNQLVDGNMFPKVTQLISQHYLRPATADEIANARFEDEPEPVRTEPKRKKKLTLKKRRG